MSAIFALANQKGGVAKTTTTGILAASLKKQGFSVLTIDWDPQGNLSMSVAAENQDSATMYEVMKGTVSAREAIQHTPSCDIIPANTILAGIEQELHNVGKEMTLREKLRDEQNGVAEAYDYILIDCPPSLELLTINALVAADSVLIPVQCEYYALEGIADLMRSIKMCNKRLNPELSVQGIVMTMYDGRTKLSDQVVNEVRKFFGKKVYKTMIPRNVRLSEAPSHRKPAIAYDKESKGARAYLHLAGELIKREEKAAKAAQEVAAAAASEVEHG